MSNLVVRNINNSKPVRQKKFNSGLKLNTSHFQKLFSLASGKVKPLQDNNNSNNNNLIKQILDKGKTMSEPVLSDFGNDNNMESSISFIKKIHEIISDKGDNISKTFEYEEMSKCILKMICASNNNSVQKSQVFELEKNFHALLLKINKKKSKLRNLIYNFLKKNTVLENEKETRDIGVQTDNVQLVSSSIQTDNVQLVSSSIQIDNVQLVSSSNQTEVYKNIPQYINTTEREAANALMILFNKSDTDSTDEEFQFTDSAYEDSSDNLSNDNFSNDNLSSSQSSEELNEELSQELIKDLMRRKSGRVTAKPIHYVDEWDRFNCGKYGKYFNNDSNVSNGKQSNIVKKKLKSDKLRSRKNIWIRVKQLCPGYKLQQYQYFLRKIKSKGITEDIDIKKLVQKASKKINRNNSFSQNSKTSSNKTCTTTTKRKRNNEDTNFKAKPKNKYIKKRNKNSYHLFLKSMRGEGYSKIELDNMYKYQKDKFKFKKRKQYSQSVKMSSEKMPLSEYDCVSIDDINFYQSTVEF